MKIGFTPFSKGHLESYGKKPGWSWYPERESFANPSFGQVFHVIFWRDGEPQNDQMLRVEQGPGCFIPINKRFEIGLVKHAFRPQVPNMDVHRREWPYAEVYDLTRPLGRASWEIPRGYAQSVETGAEAGAREGSAETSSAVVDFVEIGQICGNTAMEPHFMSVTVGLVDETKVGLPADPNEKLVKGLTFFDDEGIRSLIREGSLYCGITLSAIALLEKGGLPREIGWIKRP